MSYQFKREIPVSDNYDVIVVGGGPSGCAAAISSAREGAKTLLIEASGMLGGMATNGLVCSWTPYSDGERIIYGGISKKVFTKTKEEMPHIRENATDWVAIDYEALKLIYDEMVTQSGAEILFHTVMSSVEMKDSRNVDAIIVSNKSGLSAYKAKVYIDCTGDADLCAWAGAEFEQGDDTGDTQPATHCFMITNIDEHGYSSGNDLYGGNPKSVINDILRDKKYNIPDNHLVCTFIGPKTIGFNAGHIWGVDSTSPESITKGILEGRKLAKEFLKALTEYFPTAFANAYLAETAPTIGIRESRRILGDYYFTAKDYFARKTFEDEILRNNYFIDIHKSIVEEQTMKGHADHRFERYQKGESHGLPYRCLCPKDLDNVLVAGRSISTDRITQGSLRVMPSCLCEGEAAGMAAKFATEMNVVNIRSIDTQRLRRRLIEEDAYLPKLPTDTF